MIAVVDTCICCPLFDVLLSCTCCVVVLFVFCCLLQLVLSSSCCVVILYLLFYCPLFVVLLSSTSGFVVHCTCPPHSIELGQGSSPLRTRQSCRHTGTLGRSLSLSTAWSSDRQAAGQEKDNYITCIYLRFNGPSNKLDNSF